MSYSSLILKDSPICVWDLSETSGTTAKNEGFLKDSSFYGSYSSYMTRIRLPIVYAGTQCVRLDSETNYGVRVPSLDKMSNKNVRFSSSIEFWLKVESSTNTLTKVMKKPNSNTGIYVKDNYIIFRLGDTTFEDVSVPVSSFNKPLHIVANYSPGHISLTVNGVSKKEVINGYSLLNKSYNSADEYFDFFRLGSVKTYIDSIAIYGSELSNSVCKRHFVYGTGYTVPKAPIKLKGGHLYEMTMNHSPNTYSLQYKNSAQWKNGLNYNNYLQISDDGKVSTKFIDYAQTNCAYDVSQDTMFQSDGTLQFPAGTSLLIDDKDYAFSYGAILKFSFSSSDWNGKQLMFKVFDKNTDKSLSFFMNKVDASNYNLSYETYLDGQGDLYEPTETIIHHSATSYSSSVYFVYYEKNNVAYVKVFVSSTSYTISNTGFELPISDASIIIGADEIYPELSVSELVDTMSFTGKLIYVKSLNAASDFTSLTTTTLIDSYLSNNYITPNYDEKRIVYYTKSSAKLYLSTGMFGDSMGATRIDYGYPYSSGNTSVTVALSVDGSSNNISPGDPIPVAYGDNTTPKLLDFTFTLVSSDTEKYPAILDKFEINEFDKVIKNENNLNNISLIKKGSGSEVYYLPEVYSTPSIYYGNNTGLRLNSTQYATISYTGESIGGYLASDDSSRISAIMFSAKATASATQLISIENGGTPTVISKGANATSITISGNSSSVSYINGLSTNTLVSTEWNHYIIVFGTPINTTTAKTITIGSSSSTGDFTIDNLCIFEDSLTSSDALKYYNLMYGTYGSVVESDGVDLTIYDNETGNNHQPYPTQNIISTNASLSDTSGFLGSSITFSSNKDLAMIDGVFPKTGNKVLLPAQNKIKNVSVSDTQVTFSPTGSISINLGDVIYVLDGDENKGQYIQKTADGYIQVSILPKVQSNYSNLNDIVATKS